MLIDTTRVRLMLEHGQTSRLSGVQRARVASVSGTVWLTSDHDPRDIVLEPGEQFELATSEPILVSALGGSAVLDLQRTGDRGGERR